MIFLRIVLSTYRLSTVPSLSFHQKNSNSKCISSFCYQLTIKHYNLSFSKCQLFSKKITKFLTFTQFLLNYTREFYFCQIKFRKITTIHLPYNLDSAIHNSAYDAEVDSARYLTTPLLWFVCHSFLSRQHSHKSVGVCKVFGTNFGPGIVVRGLRATPIV